MSYRQGDLRAFNDPIHNFLANKNKLDKGDIFKCTEMYFLEITVIKGK